MYQKFEEQLQEPFEDMKKIKVLVDQTETEVKERLLQMENKIKSILLKLKITAV